MIDLVYDVVIALLSLYIIYSFVGGAIIGVENWYRRRWDGK